MLDRLSSVSELCAHAHIRMHGIYVKLPLLTRHTRSRPLALLEEGRLDSTRLGPTTISRAETSDQMPPSLGGPSCGRRALPARQVSSLNWECPEPWGGGWRVRTHTLTMPLLVVSGGVVCV